MNSQERSEAGATPDNKAGNKGCVWVFMAIVVFAIGATVVSNLSEKDEGPSDSGAIDVCHQAVDEQLKAPGTADYSGELVTHTGNDYTVTGQVDAENSFGASLRLEWSCKATWQSGTDWRPVTAMVDQ